jgi:hypothetical protein
MRVRWTGFRWASKLQYLTAVLANLDSLEMDKGQLPAQKLLATAQQCAQLAQMNARWYPFM